MKKIIVIFITSVFLYSIFLQVYRPKFVTAPTSQSQSNHIKIEEIAFGRKDCEVVLVGSSLFARFEEPYFSSRYCNLAMGGESAITGLIALERANVVPKILVVEVNVLRPMDSSLLDDVYKQPMFFLKKNLNFLRTYNQPVTLLYSKIRSYKSEFQFGETFIDSVYRSQLESQLKNFKEAAFDFSLMTELREKVKAFEMRGSRIVWIQLPVDPKIEKTRYYSQMLEWLQKSQTKFVKLECSNPQTTDGLHLVPSTIKSCIPVLTQQIAEFK